MNKPSLEKFAIDVTAGGIIFYDSTIKDVDLPEGIKAVSVPAVKMAEEMGSAKAANTFMLGVIMQSANTGVGEELFAQAIKDNFSGKAKLVDFNLKVLREAAKWAKENV